MTLSVMDSCRSHTGPGSRASDSPRPAVPAAGEHALGARVITRGAGVTGRPRVGDMHFCRIVVVSSADGTARIGESIHHRRVKLRLAGIEAQAP